MKKTFLIIIFSFFLVFSFPFFVINVSAGNSLDFEDYTANSQVDETWLTTDASGSGACVKSTYDHTDTGASLYSYYFGVTEDKNTFFNFTDADFESLEFWLFGTSVGVASTQYQFYFYDDKPNTLFYMQINLNEDGIQRFWSVGPDNKDIIPDGADFSKDEWFRVRFSAPTNNTVNVSVYDTDNAFCYGQTLGMSDFWDDWNTGQFRIRCISAQGSVLYLDDLEYNGYGTAPTGDYDEIDSCSENSIGMLTSSIFTPYFTTNPYLGHIYYMYDDMYITRFAMATTSTMADGTSTDHIFLKINGDYYANPTTSYDISPSVTIWSWENLDVWYNLSDVGFDGTKNKYFLNIQLYCDDAWSTNYRWLIPTNKLDTEKDGKFTTYKHNDWGYWVLAPQTYKQIRFSDMLTTQEMYYEMCIEYSDHSQLLNISTTDTLLCSEARSGTIYANTSYSNFYFIPTVNMTKGHTVYIYTDSPTNDINRYAINNQVGYINLPFLEMGTNYVNLSINNVNVSTETCIVTNGRDDYIYTLPNPSLTGMEIYYGYTSAYKGKIVIENSKGTEIQRFNIAPNSEGQTGYYKSLDNDVFDIALYSSVNNYTDYRVRGTRHVKSPQNIPYVEVEETIIIAGRSITVLGDHPFLGKEVHIMWGNEILAEVGYTAPFNLERTLLGLGTHEVTMRVHTSCGWITLSEYRAKTIGVYDPADKDDSSQQAPILPEITSSATRGILAITILTVFSLLPIMLCFGFNKSPKEIPTIAYGFSTAIGLVLCTILPSTNNPLIAPWVSFFVIFVGVIITVLLYFRRGNA